MAEIQKGICNGQTQSSEGLKPSEGSLSRHLFLRWTPPYSNSFIYHIYLKVESILNIVYIKSNFALNPDNHKILKIMVLTIICVIRKIHDSEILSLPDLKILYSKQEFTFLYVITVCLKIILIFLGL
jgi:hypothetical protein